MPTLEKKNIIEKYSEKKSYRQPQLKEIGEIKGITKGSDGGPGLDNGFPTFLNASSYSS